MNNGEWRALLDGCAKIMYDPEETEKRRKKAFNTFYELTRGSVGVTSNYVSQGRQHNTRSSEDITETQYSGWWNNRD